MLPDTASLVFPPSLVRSAYNWLRCLWIQTCSSSNRNHLFGVEVSSGSKKSVSHLCLPVLSFCPVSLFVLGLWREDKEEQTLLVLRAKVELEGVRNMEDVPVK